MIDGKCLKRLRRGSFKYENFTLFNQIQNETVSKHAKNKLICDDLDSIQPKCLRKKKAKNY